MRRVILVFAGILLLTTTGCDIPKVLGRLSFVQIGSDGIAVSFYPRSDSSFDSGDDGGFLSDVLDIGGVVAPLIGLFS